VKEQRETLKSFAGRFMEHIGQVCAPKPRTVAFYKQRYANLLSFPRFAAARLSEIDEQLIDQYKIARSKKLTRFKTPEGNAKVLSPASINRELAVLRRALRLAHEWKLIQRIPRIRLLRGERSREFILSSEQETAYLAACPELLRDVATLLIDSGLRLSEALTLEWGDVQLQPPSGAAYGFLTVRAGNSKSSRARNVPLSPRVADVLRRREPAEPGYVFSHLDGSPYAATHLDQVHARVRAALELPIDFVLHSHRHGFGSRLGATGAGAFDIMTLMGHSTIAISQRYVHPSPEGLELAFGRMIGAMSPQESHNPESASGNGP
jgi:integrase